MSKKKPKPPPNDRHSLHIRLNAEEHATVQADCKAMPGVPVSEGAYAKHAVLSYPKLRRLHEHVKKMAREGYSEDTWRAAKEFLTEVGL